ncbi:hypothetical protein QE152_g39748 [Popillia japonica]|uniref:Uncharacterized protein n=1 Tax=Popillia japonica TaxID=7064 RepID=A0AAW1HTH4_POPJA
MNEKSDVDIDLDLDLKRRNSSFTKHSQNTMNEKSDVDIDLDLDLKNDNITTNNRHNDTSLSGNINNYVENKNVAKDKNYVYTRSGRRVVQPRI